MRMRFGMYARLVARAGQRDALTAILLRGVEGMAAHGCQLYVVNHAPDNAAVVWVTEVWESREAHRASLELPETRRAIAEAMPLLTGEFESIELGVVGGLGLPDAPAS
jgi:quinol monooxygenase YgiN